MISLQFFARYTDIFSLSLQLGKPWMLDQDDLILNAGAWYRDEYAVQGGDLVLSAFVCLRIISAEMLQFAPQSTSSRLAFAGPQGEILSKMWNAGITAWEQKWLQLFDSSRIY